MRPQDALNAGLMLGVAFVAFGVVTSFILTQLSPVGQDFVSHTGLHLSAIDLGWTPAAALSWAWRWAVTGFLIAVIVNVVMLRFHLTSCLNIDLWNVWQMAWVGGLIDTTTGNLFLALLAAIVWNVAQLKHGDAVRYEVRRMTGIPGITVSHSMLFTAVWQYPIYWVVEHIPGLRNVRVSPETLRNRLGPLADNHVIGFFIGIMLALGARRPLGDVLTTGVIAATSLSLFPFISNFFVQSLTPISTAVAQFMERRYPGRKVYMGLEWAILGGDSMIWTVAIILVPFVIAGAVVLPGNHVLPFASIIFTSGIASSVMLTRGDLLKSFIISLLSLPVYFYAATWLAPKMTQLVHTTGAVSLPAGSSSVTWLNADEPVLTWGLVQSAIYTVTQRWYLALAIIAGAAVLIALYALEMARRNAEYEVQYAAEDVSAASDINIEATEI